jgi:hypothetical protein
LKPDEIACPMFIFWFSISQFSIHRTISRFGHDLQPQITPIQQRRWQWLNSMSSCRSS